MEDPVVPLERNLFGHPLAGLLWERQFEKTLLKYGWEKVSNWECLLVHREKGLFLSVHVDDIKLAGKKQNSNPMWRVLNIEVDFGRTNIFLRSCLFGLHSTTMPNKQRYCGQLQNHVRIANFRGAEQRNCYSLKIFVFHHGLMTWLVMQRNVWSDSVSWPTRRLNNSTKYQLHALMTTTSKKKT